MLSSQMGRISTGGRGRRVTRRRRRSRWPWVVLALAGLGMAGGFGLRGGVGEGSPEQARAGSEPTWTPGGGASDEASQAGVESEAQGEAAPTRVAEMDRPRMPETRSPQPASTPQAEPPGQTEQPVAEQMREGMRQIAEDELPEARRTLSAVLLNEHERLASNDARQIREALHAINQRLLFDSSTGEGDPLVESYRVEPGDTLSAVAPRYELTFQFVEKLNGIDANRIRVGQNLKIVPGPIHAQVVKSQYRIDLWVHDDEGNPVVIHSFPVGLGEDDSTPTGEWLVWPGRKTVNPDWRNPRTGEYYSSDDPENPVGDHWIALQPLEEHNSDRLQYGIHGTIEPETIGQQASMGCIRLGDGDIDWVYAMLAEGKSRVRIVE